MIQSPITCLAVKVHSAHFQTPQGNASAGGYCIVNVTNLASTPTETWDKTPSPGPIDEANIQETIITPLQSY